jgi:tetratricopeptide (TPR) repeat protein
MRFAAFIFICSSTAWGYSTADLMQARNRQDRAALQKFAGEAAAAAAKQPQNASAQYQFAMVQSVLAEVATELKDKDQARNAAETGIKAAEKAVELDAKRAENYRILGTLCGQAVPGNVLAALKYGRCALDNMNKAVELDPKSAQAYLGRGVGYYYLPTQFGGGPEAAIKDLQKAVELDPKNADAYLWLGIALRKVNRNADAHAALAKAVQLNPARVWAKQQLEKTPAK